MIMSKPEYYNCYTCKLQMIPESEIKHKMETTLSGKIVSGNSLAKPDNPNTFGE